MQSSVVQDDAARIQQPLISSLYGKKPDRCLISMYKEFFNICLEH